MQQRDGEPDARSDSGDPAQMRSRLGMAGSCAGRAAPQRAVTAHPILEPSPGTDAATRTAAPSARHGDFHPGHRTARSGRDRVDLGAGRPVTQAGLDSPGPGEGQEGDRRAAQRHGHASRARAERKAPDSGVYLQGSAGQAGQQESLVQRNETCRYRGLSLARSATHVGELARAGRDTALRVTGYRSSRVGRSRRWCAATRTSPRNIWRCMPATRKVTAQIRHKHRISTAHPDCRSLENNEIDGGQGQNRTADTRIFSPLSLVPGAL
jgi:hypothetical protein